MKLSLSILLLGIAASAVSDHHTHFKICVPLNVMPACEKMVEQGKTVGAAMACVPARDKYECLEKIKDHVADFEAVDPEDMYLAAKMSNDDFSVFKEIRTKEEPDAEFRYEAVAVVHKDLNIQNLHQLKGLGSCHTGIGRNVGYKVPITKLTKMGILGPLNDTTLSPRENELKALSQFFSKACLVGKWSPHQETNLRWKAQYSNLCELCEHPDKCDYPDVNSGYEGTLNCLSKGGGQIAWTKVIFVKKFFGMPYGMQPAIQSEHNPADYAYLCPDVTKRPITGPPCSWAARPWPGYMANKDLTSHFKEMREQISELNNLGESTHADWIASVLALNNKTIAKDNTPMAPLSYLEKAKYVDVIERDVMEPRRLVRICVHDELEYKKCSILQKAAYSRDIRPSLGCVKRESLSDCMTLVKEDKSEIVIVDPHEAIKGEESYNLKPLITEQYGASVTQHLVPVVKKSSSFQKLADLKGKKVCLAPYGHAAYTGTVKILLDAGLLSKTHCPYQKSLNEFFSGGVKETKNPLKCLSSGEGDIAFVPYSALPKEGGEFEVLCSDGRKGVLEAESCNLFTLPPIMIMSSKSLSSVQQDVVMFSMLSASNVYSKNPHLFLMFGSFEDEPDVLFSNHATGLVAVNDVVPSYEEYKKLEKDMSTCKS